MDRGIKRAIACWHRRSGKEKSCINIVAKKMPERVGLYAYVFPEFNQGRKVLWDGADKDGVKFMSHFPSEILDGQPNNTEMKLKYKNGSLFQIVGSDNFNSMMGTNPVGMVFSEYSLQNPYCWAYFKPILAENNGWAIFNFTPRGENHAFDLLEFAKDNPEWFVQVITADDTKIIPQEVLDRERREIIALYGNDALYQQEYFCNFSVPIAGAYYVEQLMRANKENRISNVPADERYLISTAWDLGINDKMSIWFYQCVGAEIRIVDYYENTGQGFPHYAQMLQDKGYVYAKHFAPHDIEVRELSSGNTRREIAKSLGIDFTLVPRVSIQDGIHSVRALFSRFWIDRLKCKEGLNALKNYHKEYNEARKCYEDHPYHDWSSNAADALRYLALSVDTKIARTQFTYQSKLRPDTVGVNTDRHFIPPWYQSK